MAFASQFVLGFTIASSFTLFGNAITQSFMSVPALLVDFPDFVSPDHRAATVRLGRQWPVFWRAGNVFFRPISVFGIFGYGYAAWAAATAPNSGGIGDWWLYIIAASCHAATVVHSAVNLQPINAQIERLSNDEVGRAELEKAETAARTWIRLNLVRVVTPLVAGSAALWQSLGR